MLSAPSRYLKYAFRLTINQGPWFDPNPGDNLE
jgi:hypothetical protein